MDPADPFDWRWLDELSPAGRALTGEIIRRLVASGAGLSDLRALAARLEILAQEPGADDEA